MDQTSSQFEEVKAHLGVRLTELVHSREVSTDIPRLKEIYHRAMLGVGTMGSWEAFKKINTLLD